MIDPNSQSLQAPATAEPFETVVLPHLAAAYRLARRLMRNEHDAKDAVQEASLRALRYFKTFSGGDSRAWFLKIVHNACLRWHQRRLSALTDPFDEECHRSARPAFDPETQLLRADDASLVARALGHLPDRFHHILALRELEGLSYREVADVMDIPVGTVMSRLSRARGALRAALDSELKPARRDGTTAHRLPVDAAVE